MANRKLKDNRPIKKNILYIRIAKFNLKLIFLPAKYDKISEDFKNYFVSSLLGDFALKKSPKSVDCTITFLWDNNPNYVTRKSTMYTKLSKKTSNKEVETYYQISIFQLHSLLTEVIYNLSLKKNGFLLHASSSIINSSVTLFSGNSGVGKSTIVRLLNKKFPMFTDDNILILPQKNKYFAYQLPSLSYEKIVNKGLKIDFIYFLSHGKETKARKINETEKATLILSQSYHHKENTEQTSKNIQQFTDTIRENIFYLSFPKNEKVIIEYFQYKNE